MPGMNKKVAVSATMSISVLASLMGVQTASALAPPQPTNCVPVEDINWQATGQNETGLLYLCDGGIYYMKVGGFWTTWGTIL